MSLRSAEQILKNWRKVMAVAGHSLMIKYGLPSAPSDDLIARWVRLTDSLVEQGYTVDIAARAAAQQLFAGFETHTYASESDAVRAILDAARNRNK